MDNNSVTSKEGPLFCTGRAASARLRQNSVLCRVTHIACFYILSWAATFSPATGSENQAASGPASRPERALLYQLMDRLRRGNIPKPYELSRELAALEPATIEEFLDRIVPTPASKFRFDTNQGDIQSLPEHNRKLVAAVLAETPVFLVASGHRRETNDEARNYEGLTALNILERVGSRANDIKYCIDIMRFLDPSTAGSPEVSLRFQRAVEMILLRNRTLFFSLEKLVLASDPQFKFQLLAAAGATKTLESTRLMLRLLGSNDATDALLLQFIGQSRTSMPLPIDDPGLSAVRYYLSSTNPALRRESALAAGRLEDPDAIPLLLQLLDDNTLNVRPNAHWALRKITGLSFHADAGRWNRWYKMENEEWDSGLSDLLQQLNSQHPGEIARAIDRLAAVRLHRNKIALALVPIVKHPNAKLARHALLTIRAIRAPRVIPPLVAMWDDLHPALRPLLHEALVGITGEQRPPNPGAWVDLE